MLHFAMPPGEVGGLYKGKLDLKSPKLLSRRPRTGVARVARVSFGRLGWPS